MAWFILLVVIFIVVVILVGQPSADNFEKEVHNGMSAIINASVIDRGFDKLGVYTIGRWIKDGVVSKVEGMDSSDKPAVTALDKDEAFNAGMFEDMNVDLSSAANKTFSDEMGKRLTGRLSRDDDVYRPPTANNLTLFMMGETPLSRFNDTYAFGKSQIRNTNPRAERLF